MTLSPLLHGLAQKNAPQIVLALRSQDPLPDWITHLIYLGPNLRVAKQGRRGDVLSFMQGESSNSRSRKVTQTSTEIDRKLTARGIEDEYTSRDETAKQLAQTSEPHDAKNSALSDGREPLVEMEKVRVVYGEKQVLGAWVQDVNGQPRQGLWWTVRRGQRWLVFGPNGEFYDSMRHSLTVV